MDGIGPEQLNIQSLRNRIPSLENLEVILALNTSSDGEATTMYLMKILDIPGVKVSRLARGIPVGSDLQFVDERTMQKALEKERKPSSKSG